jgi:hypothetical protein
MFLLRVLIVLALSSAAQAQAQAQAQAFLVKEWYSPTTGAHMCEYSDGTVLNVGSRMCASQIATR